MLLTHNKLLFSRHLIAEKAKTLEIRRFGRDLLNIFFDTSCKVLLQKPRDVRFVDLIRNRYVCVPVGSRNCYLTPTYSRTLPQKGAGAANQLQPIRRPHLPTDPPPPRPLWEIATHSSVTWTAPTKILYSWYRISSGRKQLWNLHEYSRLKQNNNARLDGYEDLYVHLFRHFVTVRHYVTFSMFMKKFNGNKTHYVTCYMANFSPV